MSETTSSHNAHFSLMSMAPLGSGVESHATVGRGGRNVAFVPVDALNPLAIATTTTSIIPMNVRLHHRSSG